MRVLYVMGVGRSGSTLLDILIGSHPEAVGTGELAALVSRAWSHRDRCACGLDATECPFWSAVRGQWISRVGSDQSADYVRVQEYLERTGRLPWLGRRPTPGHPTAEAYGVFTRAMFQAIERISGKAVIVDSSKNPARALALSRVTDIDLFVIHLVRDSRAVAWSFGKRFDKDPAAGVQIDQPGIPAWRSAIRWDLINAQAEWVRNRLPSGRSIVVRYEDLIGHPGSTIERIGSLIGLDLSSVSNLIAAGGSVPIGHPVAGNRLRMGGSVRLVRDDAWRGLMSPGDRRIVGVLAWPLMRRYGYR